MALGDRIKERRKSKGMTLRELAEKIGVTEATVSRYENNQIKNPTNVRLREIAAALRTDVNWLMDWQNSDSYSEEPKIVKQGWDLDEDEKELVTIFRSLNRRQKHEMMSKAYEFEKR